MYFDPKSNWIPCILKRLGDMMFAIAVALILSVAIDDATIVVHLIGHPAYVTTEDITITTKAIRLVVSFFCFVFGCVFDKYYKDFKEK